MLRKRVTNYLDLGVKMAAIGLLLLLATIVGGAVMGISPLNSGYVTVALVSTFVAVVGALVGLIAGDLEECLDEEDIDW